MKKIIFLLAMTTFLFSDFAMQAQSKKEITMIVYKTFLLNICHPPLLILDSKQSSII